jgi:predicted HTH transcriptional regulator
MTFHEFQRLVRNGETANVDFKLMCNAFNKSAGDHQKAKAELVKDICAMANNGSLASYLIIGIGDDARTVRSVTDPNITSQNVHTLVRDSIHPRPFVRVSILSWH